jgi:hypothetical protein
MDSFWRLPGPRRFIRGVKGDLGEGRNVVILLPSSPPPGLEHALYQTLCEEWQWRKLEVPRGRPPIETLFDRFDRHGPPHQLRSVEGLVACDDFEGYLVWLDGLAPEDWPTWRQFLGEYQHACRARAAFRRSLFLVPLQGENALHPPVEDVCLAHRRWDGAVDHLDMLLYASLQLQDRPCPARQRQLLVSTLAHIAVWDPMTMEWISQADAADILEPQAMLRALARERGWSSETPMAWAHGTVAHVDGRAEVHSALLAVTAPKRVEERLWRAQVGVLLPLIEEQRQELLRGLRPLIARLAETRGALDVDQLEIGELAHLCRDIGGAMDPAVRRRVERLRNLRNRLAHLEPAPASDVLARDLYAS